MIFVLKSATKRKQIELFPYITQRIKNVLSRFVCISSNEPDLEKFKEVQFSLDRGNIMIMIN